MYGMVESKAVDLSWMASSHHLEHIINLVDWNRTVGRVMICLCEHMRGWVQAQTAEMRATVAGMKETLAALHTDELRTTLKELKDSIQGQKDSEEGAVSKADLRRELRSFATTLSE